VTVEIDHVFVCVAEGAPEAQHLAGLGLAEGKRNVHRGQGTSNRCFFFRNAMLELIWVHDAHEARSGLARPTRLLDRWQGRDAQACPFGLCLRSTGVDEAAPFPGWRYEPAYLVPPMFIHIGTNSDALAEPMLFHMAPGYRPDAVAPAFRQPLDHAIGFRHLTRLAWTGPGASTPSPALAAVARSGLLTLREGPVQDLEIGFDGEPDGQRRSLAPHLPITFSW
jgi:hypothetical protein